MAEDSDQERTEEASERRIQQFRDEGRVAQSKELISAVGLFAGAGALVMSLGLFGSGFRHLMDALRAHLGDHDLTRADLLQIATTIGLTIVPPTLLVLAAASFTTIMAGLLLTQFNFATSALEPKFERLDPFANFQQHFMSIQPVVQLVKSCVVGVAVGWAAWAAVEDRLDALPVVAGLGVRGQTAFLVELVVAFLQRVIPVALAVGALDYGWQRYQLAEQMKMTKEEVKQEHKEQEGDPKIKGKRRQRARQIAMGQTLRKVKDADVVVVNPTHYAVALRYRKEEGGAPMVVARGVDHLALKIRAEASRHEIPVIENRPLARALYAQAKLGLPIPAEFYGPVAQLLAVVYRRRAAAARRAS